MKKINTFQITKRLTKNHAKSVRTILDHLRLAFRGLAKKRFSIESMNSIEREICTNFEQNN